MIDISNALVCLRRSSRLLLPRQACKVFSTYFRNPSTKARDIHRRRRSILVGFIMARLLLYSGKRSSVVCDGDFVRNATPIEEAIWMQQVFDTRHANGWSQGGPCTSISLHRRTAEEKQRLGCAFVSDRPASEDSMAFYISLTALYKRIWTTKTHTARSTRSRRSLGFLSPVILNNNIPVATWSTNMSLS